MLQTISGVDEQVLGASEEGKLGKGVEYQLSWLCPSAEDLTLFLQAPCDFAKLTYDYHVKYGNSGVASAPLAKL